MTADPINTAMNRHPAGTRQRTATQRGRYSRNKGAVAERDLVRWLRTNGFPHAERAVRTGYRTTDRTSADPGDVTGTPGIVWSVKDCAAERITEWLDELVNMAAHDTSFEEPVQLLVTKRRGHANPGEWWCWLQLLDIGQLLTGSSPDVVIPEWNRPLRMELGHVMPLLRTAGYGSPT